MLLGKYWIGRAGLEGWIGREERKEEKEGRIRTLTILSGLQFIRFMLDDCRSNEVERTPHNKG